MTTKPALTSTNLLELDWAKLGRELCAALGLDNKTAAFPLPATQQIGSWSANSVPAILTIQSEKRDFRAVVAELVARLRQPFILLAPSAVHLDASCQELLATVGAAFYGLDSHLHLTPS